MIKIIKQRKISQKEIEPDEIFFDAQNIPEFNTQQFEGRINTPISKTVIRSLGFIFGLLGIVLIFKTSMLQVVNGNDYLKRSENNSLDRTPLFADRGTIFDRNGVKLVWNEENKESLFSYRRYFTEPGFSHVLGYVTYPAKDKSGNYWQTEYTAKDGVEKSYDDVLRGTNGVKVVETNVKGDVQSENIVNPPEHGKDLTLSIDSGVQAAMYGYLKELANRASYTGGAGIIIDVKTGEILALTSFPEYDSNIMSIGTDQKQIGYYLQSKNFPLLDRAVSGLYTPGSIVKPFMALAALNEKLISPEKKILSTGALTLPNPYDPAHPSVFKDWQVQGWVDMRRAIAISSDVYFYVVGGGYKDQAGLGIDRIKKYFQLFGLDQKTGIDLPGETVGDIPSIAWKAENFPNDPTWRVGDTYHTSIGQYGTQFTPIAMARASAMMANNGHPVTPTIIKQDNSVSLASGLSIPDSYFQVVHEGMRDTGISGTSKNLSTLEVNIAAKTGSAELGVSKQFMNSWITGYFPYENPRYAFTVIVEHGPKTNTIGATYIMKSTLEWMQIHTPQYLSVDGSNKI